MNPKQIILSSAVENLQQNPADFLVFTLDHNHVASVFSNLGELERVRVMLNLLEKTYPGTIEKAASIYARAAAEKHMSRIFSEGES